MGLSKVTAGVSRRLRPMNTSLPASAEAPVRPAPPATGEPLGELSLSGWSRTFSSLSDPHFRLLWVSMLFSFTAMQTQFIAQGFLTYDLTGSATSLGVVSMGWGLGQLPFALVAGVAADRFHKRWLMVGSQGTMAMMALLTAVLIQTGTIAVWHIFAISVVSGAIFTFNVPARQAWLPELVGRQQLTNAVALTSAAFTTTGIIGPALAGILLAVPFADVATIYYVVTACYVGVLFMLVRIPGGAPAGESDRLPPYRALLDGLRYIRRHQVLPVLLLMAFVPIVVGMPYRSLFPVFQEQVYGVSEGWLGAMGAAMAVGAVIGSLWVASLATSSRRTMVQMTSGLGFGVTLIFFAASPNLWLGLVALLFVGLMANGYWALNNTLVLGAAEPAYLGRVMSVYMLSWSIMPFAALPESALADAIGVQRLVAGVGVVLIVTLLAIILLVPGYRRLRREDAARA